MISKFRLKRSTGVSRSVRNAAASLGNAGFGNVANSRRISLATRIYRANYNFFHARLPEDLSRFENTHTPF